MPFIPGFVFPDFILFDFAFDTLSQPAEVVIRTKPNRSQALTKRSHNARSQAHAIDFKHQSVEYRTDVEVSEALQFVWVICGFESGRGPARATTASSAARTGTHR